MSASSLKPANKEPSGKEKNLVRVSSRRFINLSDDGSGVMSINTTQ